ncbi:FAD-dependent oxidoreductase [Pedobacter jeongneungensis]|uniref:FAD-dependent oxidoreductase n=1 Tax=Pedobacter jeongneungensis TaxID=947309 RepID=UPI00046AFA1E|nr:NAD(P)/FAD-dependent oxidoreductase [Pedobacter jeongneungensis]
MLLENKKTAIIGGGPGGLTLARLLQLKGVEVKVYERDLNPAIRVQGATLDLHFESGLKAIEKAGLMDAFKETYRPGADQGRIIDPQGNIIFDEHTETLNDDFNNEYFRPEIDRGPLRNLLLNSLQPGTVVWSSQFLSMEQVNGQWKITFKNGTTAIADLVIGADGANSKIRPFVTPTKASYAGITILQGNVQHAESVIPNMHHLLKGGKIYVHGDGKALHVSSKGDGSIDFYTSSEKDEQWVKSNGVDFSDHKNILEWFKKEFAGWNEIWFELFENASYPIMLRPQYVVPLDQTWDAKPNVTLLGDAAHIMPPSGEGVNLAMLDALDLSECLTSSDYTTLETAISAYEKKMLERGAEATQDSLEMAEWMHADDAQERMLKLLGQNI